MATRNLDQKVPKFKESLKLRNFVTYPIQEAKFYVVTTPPPGISKTIEM